MKNIYNKNKQIIYDILKLVEEFRNQNYHKVSDFNLILNNLNSNLDFILKNNEYFEIDINCILNILKDLLNVQQNEDYILLGDILEYRLMPVLEAIQEKLQSEIFIDNEEIFNKNINILMEKNKNLADLLQTDLNDGVMYGLEYAKNGELTINILDGENIGF